MLIKVDISTWAIEAKVLLQAAAVSLLYAYDNKFDGAGITADHNTGDIEILDSLNPPANLKDIWSQTKLKTWIDAYLADLAVKNAEAQVEQTEKDAEIVVSEFTNLKLKDVDAKIDSIQNLTQMKIILKKLARYLVARM